MLQTQDCKLSSSGNKGIVRPYNGAEKYEYTDENVTLLAQRIIQGGAGTWGDTPMNPHPDLHRKMPENRAYVLSLDGEQPK